MDTQESKSRIPTPIYPGMALNWKSPYSGIELYVEVPFWLLIPDGTVTVTHGECSLRISICSEKIEIQDGRMFQAARSNVLHIESAGTPTPRAEEVLRSTKNGFVLRRMKTVLILHTRCFSDCLSALHESDRRNVDATMYFQSLAYAHLPFLNRVINAYRKSTGDPFPMEVTEWDVPVWFVTAGDGFRRISLLPYADAPCYPRQISINDGSQSRIEFGTVDDLQLALNASEFFGDIEMLDAWALYQRGRFGDAIRSLVTGIEIAVEYGIRNCLLKGGMPIEQIEARLERTFNNFEQRLSEYCSIAKRRLPGPLISVLPYMNGIRLKSELDATRSIRHKIVHEGMRFERSLGGNLLRHMETMTWLYNWIQQADAITTTHIGKGYPLKTQMAAVFDRFEASYASDGVVISPWDRQEIHSNIIAQELLEAQLSESIDRGTSDIEKFALMCFDKLNVKASVVVEEDQSPIIVERYILKDGARYVPVFLIDFEDILSQVDVMQIASRILILNQRGNPVTSALCVCNHQNCLSWQLREVEGAIPETVVQFAQSCGITLISAVDLLLVVKAMDLYLWKPEKVQELLYHPGRQGLYPPNCRKVGVLKHFYEKPQVMSVEIVASAVLRVGDTVVIRLNDRLHVETVASIQINGMCVPEAPSGARAGVKTSLHRKDIKIGSAVCVMIGEFR